MSFFVIFISHIVVMLTTIYFISIKWKFYANDLFGISSLQQYNILSRVWPTDKGFSSLKYSAVRHSMIPLAFSALIWFVNAAWLNRVASYLALLYVWSPVSRYRVRNADYKEAGQASQQMLKPVKSACFSLIVCAIANYIVTLICYGFRP